MALLYTDHRDRPSGRVSLSDITRCLRCLYGSRGTADQRVLSDNDWPLSRSLSSELYLFITMHRDNPPLRSSDGCPSKAVHVAVLTHTKWPATPATPRDRPRRRHDRPRPVRDVTSTPKSSKAAAFTPHRRLASRTAPTRYTYANSLTYTTIKQVLDIYEKSSGPRRHTRAWSQK